MFSCTKPAYRNDELIFILYALTCRNYLFLKNDDFSIGEELSITKFKYH